MEKQVLFKLDNFPNGAKIVNAALSGDYRVVVSGGGVRGGKTLNSLGALVILHKLYPKSRSVIIRDSLETLKRNTLPSCNKVIPSNFVKNFNQSSYTWTFENGSQMFFMSENYATDKNLDRFNGLEINFALLEQVEELQKITFEKVLERIGSYVIPDGLPQPESLVLATVNPTNTWIRQLVYDRYINGTLPKNWIYIPTLLEDNPHIPDDYKESLKELKITNPIKYERFVKGDWEIQEQTGGEFYWGFNMQKHTADCKHIYNLDVPLHLSFDFNSLPYMTLLVWQIFGKEAYLLKEFCLEPPENTVRQTIYKFINSEFGSHQSHINIYGDYSGKANTPHDERIFDIVFRELKKNKFRVNDLVRPNPSVATRGDFMNEILSVNYHNINIIIDEDCIKTITDFMKVLKNQDGTKKKIKIKDHKTGLTFETVGHTSDATDYIICQCFKDSYMKFIKRDDFTETDNKLENKNYKKNNDRSF